MSRSGRPKQKLARVRQVVYIREDLHGKATLMLLDPVSLKVEYGAWTNLFEPLLDEWINRQTGERYVERKLSLEQIQKLIEQGVGFRITPDGSAILTATQAALLEAG